ncbi:MAG TPA: hypothetical protein PKE66_03955 [Pyrinomonadaceae bacterium]|nr:hypothetical protein [Pyrinomonadaceae bacterium]
MKSFFTAFFLLAASVGLAAQVRPAGTGATSDDKKDAAPQSFEAKYEGGMFGYGKKESGTLRFDDVNERIVFHGKDGKEKFSIGFQQISVISPQSRSVTSTTGNVVRNIPLPGSVLGGLIKEKKRYLIVQFADRDADVSGTVSFKLDNLKLLESVIQTLGEKAKMTQRGDAYYRPRTVRNEI